MAKLVGSQKAAPLALICTANQVGVGRGYLVLGWLVAPFLDSLGSLDPIRLPWTGKGRDTGLV